MTTTKETIRELDLSELNDVNGAGFWGAVKSVVSTAGTLATPGKREAYIVSRIYGSGFNHGYSTNRNTWASC